MVDTFVCPQILPINCLQDEANIGVVLRGVEFDSQFFPETGGIRDDSVSATFDDVLVQFVEIDLFALEVWLQIAKVGNAIKSV